MKLNRKRFNYRGDPCGRPLWYNQIGGVLMAEIIDGKLISSKIKEQVKQEVEELKNKGINPALAVILVGQDPASMVYVNNKEKTCDALGIESKVYRLEETTTTEELLNLMI